MPKPPKRKSPPAATADAVAPPVVTFVPAGPENESEESALKRWEEFYTYSSDSFQRVHDHWSSIEEKASKYLQILGLFIGGGALALGEVGKVAASATDRLHWAFLAFYATTALTAVGAFSCFLWILKLHSNASPPTRPEMVEFFQKNRYLDILLGLGRETLAAANTARIKNQSNVKIVGAGYVLMWLSAVSLLLASATAAAEQLGVSLSTLKRRRKAGSESLLAQA